MYVLAVNNREVVVTCKHLLSARGTLAEVAGQFSPVDLEKWTAVTTIVVHAAGEEDCEGRERADEMDIGYVWDEAKYERVRSKRSIEFGAVVDVFEGEETLYEHDPQGNPGRLMAVGATRQGRILQVIFSDEDAPLVRIITAFEASKEWRDEFEKQ